jgi:hypothetical protein
MPLIPAYVKSVTIVRKSAKKEHSRSDHGRKWDKFPTCDLRDLLSCAISRLERVIIKQELETKTKNLRPTTRHDVSSRLGAMPKKDCSSDPKSHFRVKRALIEAIMAALNVSSFPPTCAIYGNPTTIPNLAYQPHQPRTGILQCA